LFPFSHIKKTVKSFIEQTGLWIYWFLLRAILKYLPLKISYALATLLSWVYYPVSPRKRTVMGKELEKLFGNRLDRTQVRRIVKRSYEIYFKRIIENLMFGSFSRKQWESLVTIEGLDILNVALEKEKGVILLLCHFGSFLLPLPVLGYKGYKIYQVARNPLFEKGPMHKKLFQLRKSETDKMPFSFIRTDQYLGPIVKTLKSNGIVVIAFDGRVADRWVSVPFLNRIAQFSPGPFKLAIRTGATVLPTFVVREDNNRHKIFIEPPMEFIASGEEEGILRQHTEMFAKIFERYLSNYPCHFGWILYTNWDEVSKGLSVPLFID
jgi:lauroyl/myristoyl acyltransferase